MRHLFTWVFNMLLPGSSLTSLCVFFSHMEVKLKLCSWTRLNTGWIPCLNDKWHGLRAFFKLTAPQVDFHIDWKAQSHYYDNIFESISEVFLIFPKLNRQSTNKTTPTVTSCLWCLCSAKQRGFNSAILLTERWSRVNKKRHVPTGEEGTKYSFWNNFILVIDFL